jgi:hypothetical protein
MSALLNLGDKITAGNRADATFFYKKRVLADSGTLLTEAETDANNRELLAQSLFDKASVVYTAGGIKASKAYSVKGTDFTVTRAGVKNVVNRAGVLTEIPANTPATEFVNGVLKGTLIEPARTNRIRNNTMQGAVVGVVGSGGARPTNWVGANLAGLSEEIVSSTVIDGIEVLTVRVFGTADATAQRTIYFDSLTGITASNGQTWTGSFWFSVVNAIDPPSDYNIVQTERTVAGSFIKQVRLALTPSNALTRVIQTRTLDGGGTVERVQFGIDFSVVNGQSYDFTIRIGLPQMEQSAVATSVIKTTDTAITQPADVITATGVSGLIGQTEGTVLLEVDLRAGKSNTARIITVADNNFVNGFILNQRTQNDFEVIFRVNDVNLSTRIFSGNIVTGKYRIGIKYQLGESFNLFVNGSKLADGNVFSGFSSPLDRFYLGTRQQGDVQFNDTTPQALIFKQALTDQEIQTWTTL